MAKRLTYSMLAAPLFVCAVYGTLSYTHCSGRSEGRPNGMTYASVVEDINLQEQNLTSAARLFSINPRMLGSAIAAERANNFLPYIENIVDAIFGTSVGFSQVSILAFREILTELYTDQNDSHFRIDGKTFQSVREYFGQMRTLKRYERKALLLFSPKINTAAAAMILRHSLDRYDALAPRFNVFRRPDIAATLYHRSFPDTIQGIPDSFGQLALKFYRDSTFMPHCPQ